MKAKLSIVTLVLAFTFLGCKKKSSVNINYLYSDKPSVVDCKTTDSLLLKEALYTFENDLLNAYDPQQQNLRKAYPGFLRNVANGRLNYQQLVSEHAIEVFNGLKTSDLWKDGKLNYENKVFTCLGEGMKNGNLKTTYNALLSSGYMSNKLFGAPLATQYSTVMNDKYLATFVALDFYFSHLEGVVPAPPAPAPEKPGATNQANKPVDFNKAPAQKPGLQKR